MLWDFSAGTSVNEGKPWEAVKAQRCRTVKIILQLSKRFPDQSEGKPSQKVKPRLVVRPEEQGKGTKRDVRANIDRKRVAGRQWRVDCRTLRRQSLLYVSRERESEPHQSGEVINHNFRNTLQGLLTLRGGR